MTYIVELPNEKENGLFKNGESITMTKISIDPESCTHCGICMKICPVGIIIPGAEDNVPFIPAEAETFCSECGACEAYCPTECISPIFETEHYDTTEIGTAGITSEQLGTYMVNRRSIRNYLGKPVDKATIKSMLDIVRYSPSGMNSQPVNWTIVHDTERVKKLTAHSIEWMRNVLESDVDHPVKPFMPALIGSFEAGNDPICRGAPHIAIAHAPAENPMAFTDSIIALTWFELAAPGFGLGACWAGFLKIAADSYEPIREELGLPEGHAVQYAMMFGYPKYKAKSVPGRNPAKIKWI
jgi:nitroreductase/ferredoxin